jgi:hypothetical protein
LEAVRLSAQLTALSIHGVTVGFAAMVAAAGASRMPTPIGSA